MKGRGILCWNLDHAAQRNSERVMDTFRLCSRSHSVCSGCPQPLVLLSAGDTARAAEELCTCHTAGGRHIRRESPGQAIGRLTGGKVLILVV